MEQTITMSGRGEDLVETLLKSLVENKNNQTVWQSLRQQAEKSLGQLELCPPQRDERKRLRGWKKVRCLVTNPFFQTYLRRKYQWVQLAGHQGHFKEGEREGTVLKKLCKREEIAYNKLMMDDQLREFVPQFFGRTAANGENYLVLQDCLSTFNNPTLMDCKIGTRTYLEDELAKARENPEIRSDMYDKMVAVDPLAPSDEEHRVRGVTKPRIEGINNNGFPVSDFKTTRTREQVTESFQNFVAYNPSLAEKYLERLTVLREKLSMSEFFLHHEMIGSSLLFIHDSCQVNVWIIDFAKTVPVPGGVSIDHRSTWRPDNHEDGYLTGMDNIMDIFHNIRAQEANKEPGET